MDYKNSYNHLLKGKILNKYGKQKAFAEALGVSEQTVSNWICYAARPTYKHARKTGWLFRIPLKELFPRSKYGKITAN